MPRIHFRLETPLSQDAVMAALTDFSPNRAEVWSYIDKDHYRVHGHGAGWAEVTEGDSRAWERNRYEWGEIPGRLVITAIDSNTWKPGSRWEYQLDPGPGGGTSIDVTVTRLARGPRGRLLGLALGLAGSRILRADMHRMLGRVAARPEPH